MNKIFVHNDETNVCFTGNRLKISIDHVTITAARGGWLRNGKLTPLLHSVLMVTLQVEFRKAHERWIQNLIQCIILTMIKFMFSCLM